MLLHCLWQLLNLTKMVKYDIFYTRWSIGAVSQGCLTITMQRWQHEPNVEQFSFSPSQTKQRL